MAQWVLRVFFCAWRSSLGRGWVSSTSVFGVVCVCVLFAATIADRAGDGANRAAGRPNYNRKGSSRN